MNEPPQEPRAAELPPILPEHIPVEMPELPTAFVINTHQQFKAISDETRSRILGIIRHIPATAKQLADRLGMAPGTVGHHLQVLEAAGLAQVVARRQIRGIVAKYFTRTARIFQYEMPPESIAPGSIPLDIATTALNELRDTIADMRRRLPEHAVPQQDDKPGYIGFPHARLGRDRAQAYALRLAALTDEFLAEPSDPAGEIYGLFFALFTAPEYMQVQPDRPQTDSASLSPPAASKGTEEHGDPRNGGQ